MRYLAIRRAGSGIRSQVVDAFNHVYYDLGDETWGATYWLGTRTLKCPLDLWIYQEIIFELKPDLIVESGTAAGGSALYLATICDLLGHGEVVTIDIEGSAARPQHRRIRYLLGSSTSSEIVEEVSRTIDPDDRVMVILDSDHREEHVFRELEIYSDFVTVGSYLIVEDTLINGHPVAPFWGPGPMEAVEKFLRIDSRFVVDRNREKFLLTFNPRGYLKKTKP